MKTISTTYCKRFDSSCYHPQCIANSTALIMLLAAWSFSLQVAFDSRVLTYYSGSVPQDFENFSKKGFLSFE